MAERLHLESGEPAPSAMVDPDVQLQRHLAKLRKRIGDDLAMQGNMDPCVLFTDKDTIYRHVDDIIEKAGGLSAKHVMNLGHGVMQKTPEENVGHFFEACRTAHLRK